jgi:DNA-binding NtrC family response regulator
MILVLMVDDDPNMLEISKIFLERSGDIKVDTTE